MDIPYCKRTNRRPFKYVSSNGRRYTLHACIRVLRNNNEATLFYFRGATDTKQALSAIPAGWTVGESKNGFPYLRREAATEAETSLQAPSAEAEAET